MEKPCFNCPYQHKPDECGWGCFEWRQWFVRAWDKARIKILLHALGLGREEHNANSDSV